MNDNVIQEAAHFRQVQLTKYDFSYVLNVAVANNTTLPAILTIEQDADFLVERITGNAYGPTDVNGLRLVTQPTVFPLAGTSVGFADRGLMIKITDTGAGRELTNGFVPAELLLSPGYGIAMNMPYPFRYYALRNTKFRFDIRNRDTSVGTGDPAPDLFHFISITLNGFKYMTPN